MFKALSNILGKLMTTHVELHASEICPECGSQLARETGDTNGVWLCPNPDCPPQVLKRVALWASPEAMDIRGCDAAMVAQLVQRGLVRDAAEFYRLRFTEIASLDGMDEARTRALWDAISASKQREAWRMLFGLGIPNIGAAEAQMLGRHFTSLEELFAAGRERLATLEGVTEVMARSLTHWYGDPVNRKLMQRLAKAGSADVALDPPSPAVGFVHRDLGDEVVLAISRGDAPVDFPGVLHRKEILRGDSLDVIAGRREGRGRSDARRG